MVTTARFLPRRPPAEGRCRWGPGASALSQGGKLASGPDCTVQSIFKRRPPTEPRNVTKEAQFLLEMAAAIRMICDALEDALEPNGRSLSRLALTSH